MGDVCLAFGEPSTQFDLLKLRSALDDLTVMQVLTRELKAGEGLARLSVLCWKTVTPSRLNPVLLEALESHIPSATLEGLKASK